MDNETLKKAIRHILPNAPESVLKAFYDDLTRIVINHLYCGVCDHDLWDERDKVDCPNCGSEMGRSPNLGEK